MTNLRSQIDQDRLLIYLRLTILAQLKRIEQKHNEMFHVFYPIVWSKYVEANASNNPAQLERVIQALDALI